MRINMNEQTNSNVLAGKKAVFRRWRYKSSCLWGLPLSRISGFEESFLSRFLAEKQSLGLYHGLLVWVLVCLNKQQGSILCLGIFILFRSTIWQILLVQSEAESDVKCSCSLRMFFQDINGEQYLTYYMLLSLTSHQTFWWDLDSKG